MTPFTYHRADNAAAALQWAGLSSRYLGGGTNLVDLMRENIERPEVLVDVSGLSKDIQARADGSVWIGAAASNSAVAADPAIRQRFPVLARAILAGASGQIRNMATVGGNILQRTRCQYFYDQTTRCNKRVPGSGCDAVDGFNRIHAILGASAACIATHPSDMCVALAALDAVVHLQGPAGERSVALVDLHRLPGGEPQIEHVLAPGELVVAVEIPPLAFGASSTYRKVRDRASYAFALISVAAALQIEDGRVRDVRLALGGVAAKPWRAWKAEDVLRGAPATEASFRAAARAELEGAAGLRDNNFKIELARRTLVAVMASLAGETA